MFIIASIVDLYSFVAMINDLEENAVVLFIMVTSNIILLCLVISLIRDKLRIKKLGNITIDEIELTVISQKNLNRKQIKGFQVDTVKYKYEFSNNGFDAYFTFGGIVTKRIGKINGITLNFSGDSNQTINDIDAYAYDLISDPDKTKKINGTVNDKNGLNKGVFFKFLEPLKKNNVFLYTFHYRWNNCVNPDKDYIAAIPPFKHINPNVFTLEVSFKDKILKEIRPYIIIDSKVKNGDSSFLQVKKEEQYFESKIRLDKNFNMAIVVFYFC